MRDKLQFSIKIINSLIDCHIQILENKQNYNTASILKSAKVSINPCSKEYIEFNGLQNKHKSKTVPHFIALGVDNKYQGKILHHYVKKELEPIIYNFFVMHEIEFDMPIVVHSYYIS